MKRTLLLFCFLLGGLHLVQGYNSLVVGFCGSASRDSIYRRNMVLQKSRKDSIRAILKDLEGGGGQPPLGLSHRAWRKKHKKKLADSLLTAGVSKAPLKKPGSPALVGGQERSLSSDSLSGQVASRTTLPLKDAVSRKAEKLSAKSKQRSHSGKPLSPSRKKAGTVSIAGVKDTLSTRLQESPQSLISTTASPQKDSLLARAGSTLKSSLRSWIPPIGKTRPDSQSIRSSVTSYIKGKGADPEGLKAIGHSLPRKKKKVPFGIGLGYGSMYIPDGSFSGKDFYADVFSVAADVQLGKVPLHFDISQRYNSDEGFAPSQMNLFKFEFDRPRFQQMFLSDEERLKSYRRNYLQGLSLPDYTRRSIHTKLRDMPEGATLSQNPDFAAYLKDPAHVNELLAMDDFQLNEKLTELARGKVTSTGKGVNAPSVKSPKEIDPKLKKGIDSVGAVIRSIKKGLKDSGLDEDKFAVYQKYLSGKEGMAQLDEDALLALSKRPGANKAQSLMSRVRSLKTGSFGATVPGGFMGQEQLVQGFDVTLQTRRGPVQVGFGSQNDAGQPKDLDFENSSYNQPRYLGYLSVATHNGSLSKGKLSWTGTFNRQEVRPNQEFSTLQRSSFALGLSQSMDMKKLGLLRVDLSKSAGYYHNTSAQGSDDLYLQKNAISYYLSNQLMDNFSVGLTHQLDAERYGLSSSLYFNYADIGYQNPASAGMSQLKTRYGGALKKQFLRDRLSLGARADMKHTPLSASQNGAYWKTYNLQLDTRYRLGRGSNISLKYMDNGTDRMDTVDQRVFGSRKVQLAMNNSFKLAGHYTYTHIDIAGQRLRNSTQLASNGELLTMNYTQSTVMKGYTLNGTLFYNKEVSAFKLIGNMANAELGCQYVLLKKFSLNTAGTYLSSQGQARQLGLRQSFDYSPAEGLDISLAGDVRKNLITPLYPVLFPAGRAEFSIKYYIRN